MASTSAPDPERTIDGEALTCVMRSGGRRTLAPGSLEGLGMVISLKLAEWPSADREWSWLREIAFDYDLEAYPKPRFDPIVTSERLVDVGWSDPLSSAEPRLARHPGRNGLMGTRHR